MEEAFVAVAAVFRRWLTYYLPPLVGRLTTTSGNHTKQSNAEYTRRPSELNATANKSRRESSFPSLQRQQRRFDPPTPTDNDDREKRQLEKSARICVGGKIRVERCTESFQISPCVVAQHEQNRIARCQPHTKVEKSRLDCGQTNVVLGYVPARAERERGQAGC